MHLKDMFSLYKDENQLYKMRFTGAEIKKILEYGYARQYNQMKSENDLLLNYQKNAEGKFLKNNKGRMMYVTPSFNFTSADGIIYNVDVTKEAGNRVNIISMSDGSKFNPKKEYVVAINSYQGSGGGGFLTEGLGLSKDEIRDRMLSEEYPAVRALIADYINSQDTVVINNKSNWNVIPEKYFKSGLKNEKQIKTDAH